ncbi:MAG: cytochrome c oxidase subunit 3 [Gammaproteobacteria bacterium]|nr:cytochrome c oxidase subunit 3 [Gammaproteobacteria bacterium]
MHAVKNTYYVPSASYWPIMGSIGLVMAATGAVTALHNHNSQYGFYLLLLGFTMLVAMLFGWFRSVICEDAAELYSRQVEQSFRWGMAWFIFSEVAFFGAFFGVLFYARNYSVPWLAGSGDGVMTHHLLWPEFQGVWPLVENPDPTKFQNPKWYMGAWGVPAINTLILLSSAVTVTWAHWGVLQARRLQIILGLAATVLLGSLFLYFQAYEYIHAYQELELKISSGIYGTIFFTLTGFHGLHVAMGTLMLTVIGFRSLKGHFSPDNHFAFEATAWYWHFVDVVWLCLFVFVYCL